MTKKNVKIDYNNNLILAHTEPGIIIDGDSVDLTISNFTMCGFNCTGLELVVVKLQTMIQATIYIWVNKHIDIHLYLYESKVEKGNWKLTKPGVITWARRQLNKSK